MKSGIDNVNLQAAPAQELEVTLGDLLGEDPIGQLFYYPAIENKRHKRGDSAQQPGCEQARCERVELLLQSVGNRGQVHVSGSAWETYDVIQQGIEFI